MNSTAEVQALAIEHVAEPNGVCSRCAVEAEFSQLQGHHLQAPQEVVQIFDIEEIAEREVRAKEFVSADALIVVDEIAASVEDQLAPINFDPHRVMG